MSNYSRLLDIFERLVGFRTITGDHESAEACLKYIESILEPYDLTIDRYRSNGYQSLVMTTKATKTPKLILQAHVDVVPGDEEQFTLRGEANKLVGRGAFDMKYAAACYLYLVERLGESCKDYDFGIMLTFDEEHDGLNGVDYLLDQGFSCKVCLLPDGGDDWRLESAAKGRWGFDAVVTGKSSHASRPWDGDNAADKLWPFIKEIQNLAPVTDHTDTTLVLTGLQSGEARNQIPAHAKATFDMRFLTDERFDDIYAKVCTTARTHEVEIINEDRSHALELDVTLPLIQKWETAVRKIRGNKTPIGYGLSFGASDARFFAAHDIPTIVTRPKGGGMHAADEWIDEAEFYQFYDVVETYVRDTAKTRS